MFKKDSRDGSVSLRQMRCCRKKDEEALVLKKVLFVVVIGTILWSPASTQCQDRVAARSDQASAALAGSVTSDIEGSMEGVLVSAKAVGSTITVTVVSDHQGRYQFPGTRLQPGKYRLSVRAVGYQLQDPGMVEVKANRTAQVNLKLLRAPDLAPQLMNAEWMLSVPGNEEQKRELFDCVGCHSLSVVVNSRYDAKAFVDVLDRMRNYGPPSSFIHGNRRPVRLPFTVPPSPEDAKFASYLSSINLSSSPDGKWRYELKMLPRPKGKATRVIITEYDLPRPESQPHDAAVDPEGMVWYTDFSRSYLGQLDPRSGDVKEWRVPVLKQGFPEGSHEIRFDKEGNPWFGMLFQAGIAKFDKNTEKMITWGLPPEHNNVRTRSGILVLSPDGTAWTKIRSGLNEVHQLDPKSNRYIASFPIPDAGFYGVEIDSQGRYLYLAGLGTGVVGKMDAKTGEVNIYPTPTPASGPRRGGMDSQDRFWFAEYYAGKIGVFDPKTEQFKEWPIPIPGSGPYDVVVDKNGEVWSGGMHTDHIFRLNPTTGEVSAYLLPTLSVNIRRIDVGNSTDPVSVWVGENHQAKIARLEPLE